MWQERTVLGPLDSVLMAAHPITRREIIRFSDLFMSLVTAIAQFLSVIKKSRCYETCEGSFNIARPY